MPGKTGKGNKDQYGMSPADWARLDALMPEQVHAAAVADPDAQPIPPERVARTRRVSLAKFVRHKLAMTEEAFATAYAIPLETLRSWERHEAEPDAVAMAYLRAIERAPAATRVPEPA